MKLEILRQKIDYDSIITGKDLDYDTYEKKFEMWDYVLKNDLADKPEALVLIQDITIWAYAFFRDDSGKPWKMTCYQDAISSSVCSYNFQPNDPNRYGLFKASNQIGKSAFLCLLAIYYSQMRENKNIVMISKSLPQSQFLLAQIRWFLNNSVFGENWKEDVGETANTTMLTFAKKSEGKETINRIICAPAGEGTLGYPVHYLFMDEADFYEDGKTFFWKVGFPRTKKTKGQIILFSNPDPERSKQTSLLWELWRGDLFKRKFSFYFLDAPWNTKEEFETDKKNSPSYIFASTHMGEFPPDGGGFFTDTEIKDMINKDWINTLPLTDDPVYIGLDLAKVHDNSVLSIGITKPGGANPGFTDEDLFLDVKYLEKFPQKTDYIVVLDRLKEIVDFYDKRAGVVAIGFDATGVGQAIDEMIAERGLAATPVIFSLQNKSRMFANFKMLAEQRRIKIVDDADLINQLSGLEFKKTASGHLSVHHAAENIRDDYPDSLCCLIDVSVGMGNVETTFEAL